MVGAWRKGCKNIHLSLSMQQVCKSLLSVAPTNARNKSRALRQSVGHSWLAYFSHCRRHPQIRGDYLQTGVQRSFNTFTPEKTRMTITLFNDWWPFSFFGGLISSLILNCQESTYWNIWLKDLDIPSHQLWFPPTKWVPNKPPASSVFFATQRASDFQRSFLTQSPPPLVWPPGFSGSLFGKVAQASAVGQTMGTYKSITNQLNQRRYRSASFCWANNFCFDYSGMSAREQLGGAFTRQHGRSQNFLLSRVTGSLPGQSDAKSKAAYELRTKLLVWGKCRQSMWVVFYGLSGF